MSWVVIGVCGYKFNFKESALDVLRAPPCASPGLEPTGGRDDEPRTVGCFKFGRTALRLLEIEATLFAGPHLEIERFVCP